MRRFALPAIVLLGLLLRAVYILAVYEPSLEVYHGGEFELYRIGAEVISRGDLSFSNDVFLLRTPLFPLLMSVLNLQPALILLVNTLLSGGIIAVTYALAVRLDPANDGGGAALLSALLVALDPASIHFSATLLAEPLANLTFTIALLSVLFLRGAHSVRGIWLWGALSSVLIVLSALARPAAEYLWLPFGLWIVCVRREKRTIAILSLALFALIGSGAWRSHNAATFGHSAFTTLGTWNLLYKRATSVLHHGADLSVEATTTELARRVEARLGNDFSQIDASRQHYHYIGTPELQSVMTSVATDVFISYPLHYALTFIFGLYRQILDTAGPLLMPGYVWNIGLLAAASSGFWQMLRARRIGDLAFVLLPCAYFLLGSLVYCTTCSSGRDRATVMPLLAIMAAHGIAHFINRRRAKSANSARAA